MKPRRTDSLFIRLVLSAALATSCGSAWAASSSCSYHKTGIEIGGTGMGGTGVVAKGTGMGGTGISPETAMPLAGKVIFSRGDVEAQSNGRSRQLAKGDPVCVGETIVTSQSGTLQIRMIDEGLVAIRHRTRFKIEKFAFDGTDRDTSLFTLFQGAARFVTGKIGKLHPQNDYIQTQTAIIGVRGTDHEATVILPGDGKGPSGTYDKVNKGITFIRTEKGEIDIHPNQVGVAVSTEKMPVLLKDIPDFYKTDPAIKEEGGAFEGGTKGEGSGGNDVEDPSGEQAGKGSGFDHASKNETASDELPGKPGEMIMPETTTVPEMSEPPALPEKPEPPSLPELPESPDRPEQ